MVCNMKIFIDKFVKMLDLVKKGQLKRWFYEFKHGHPFLLGEEVAIIVNTRLNDKNVSWMNDKQIKELIKIRVKTMYKNKFPNAKRWSIKTFTKFI